MKDILVVLVVVFICCNYEILKNEDMILWDLCGIKRFIEIYLMVYECTMHCQVNLGQSHSLSETSAVLCRESLFCLDSVWILFLFWRSCYGFLTDGDKSRPGGNLCYYNNILIQYINTIHWYYYYTTILHWYNTTLLYHYNTIQYYTIIQ